MTLPAIDIDNLTVTVDVNPVFSGLCLRLPPGRKMTLVGRSGCGKSTLLRCLLGFVPFTHGSIHIFGQELTADSVWQLRTRMAYVAQEPEMTAGRVRDFLEHPFTFAGNRHLRNNLAEVPTLLDRLLLSQALLDKEISSLSGGEKQRIALLSALLLDRAILLLDEASSALDPAAKQAVIELLRARQALTVLSVSHDQEWMGCSDALFDLCDIHSGSAT